MKFASAFAIMFACLLGTTLFLEVAEATKKKKAKLLGALLLGAALGKKPKIIPLPLPLPLPIPIQIKKEQFVPYPEPVPYPVTKYISIPEPVYVGGGYGGGGYGGGGYGGGGYGGGGY